MRIHKGGRFFIAAMVAAVLSSAALAAEQAAEAQRLVSLLPSHTDIVVLLEQEQKLVGVSDAETPDTLPDVPRVGGLSPNWEALVSLKPDLILADVSHKNFQSKFKRFKLATVFLPSTKARSIEDVYELVREIAKIAGGQDKAELWITDANQRLDAVLSHPPTGAGPRVYFEIWPKPLQAAGPESLQGRLLERAFARNIVPESKQDLPLMSSEWVVHEAPEVILHTGVVPTAEIIARPGWDKIPAVKNNRVHLVDRDKVSRAGPQIIDALEELVKILYPDPTPVIP
jgi:iron complex transport system substrate-binding protein